ncbi:hypothetical protein, partial [Maribacter sp. 2304DJ31-5]|uniref:hypothetical protein n=1 Tax=Maribacter sp. 2304DJ31-5 TaxID=3386273 RepID=UPI0039BD4A1D
MDKRILVIFLLISGFTFAQTTVTLEDQCNCEVLQGTDVSSPGAVTPIGADLGDLYVNTNTGTIYFWDGDSWELTSSDDQQLTGFTFNDATNLLTLDLENGGSLSVDLSNLSDTLSDTNTVITSYTIDAVTNSLVITDSDLNTFSVSLAAIAAIIDTDTQYSAGTGLDLTATEFSVRSGGVGTTELANDAVTTGKILNDAVTVGKIADGGADQVLATDGSGNPQWVDQTSIADPDAEQNVQSDWNQTTVTADDFILNKPTTITGAQAAAIAAN